MLSLYGAWLWSTNGKKKRTSSILYQHLLQSPFLWYVEDMGTPAFGVYWRHNSRALPPHSPLGTWDLGTFCSVDAELVVSRAGFSAVGLELIRSCQPLLLSSSYTPRPIFPLPFITPGPGTGQVETTLAAQSLLKLFQPSNPNPAQTYLLCLAHSFLEKPQHRLWTMLPLPLPQFVLPPDPQCGSFSWKLQVPNTSFKAVVSKSVIFTYLIRTNPSYILTQVQPPSSVRRGATCTPRKCSPHKDTHILWRRMGSHMCYPNINMPRASAGVCLCPVIQFRQSGHCAGKGRAAWCYVLAGALHLVPDAYAGNSIGGLPAMQRWEQHFLPETLCKNGNYVTSSLCFILTVHLSLIT